MATHQPQTLHTFYAPDDLWRDAQDEAVERGETVSDAIRRSLKRYTRERRTRRTTNRTEQS